MPKKNDLLQFDIPELQGSQFVTPGLTRDDVGRPEAIRMPDQSQLLELSRTMEGQAQLSRLLEHYGVFNPIEQSVTQSMQYVSRMTGYTGAELKDAVNDLLANQQRTLLGMTRRVQEQFSSLVAIDGNAQQEMIWIDEGDENECDACDSRAGEIMTWAEWQSVGPPGARVCAGGDYCRCVLIPID